MSPRPDIKLNGVSLPRHMIAAEAQHHPSPTPASAFRAAARALIVRTLLLEEAMREGISPQPEFVAPGKRELDDEARIRALMEAHITIAEPDENQCKAFYDANQERFRSPDLCEVSHILFQADAHDEHAYAASMARAQAVASELAQYPARFEDIARQQSDCDSRVNGGRLGQVVPGEAVPEFAEALEGLEVGQISAIPIRSRFGAHILKLDARAEGQVLPFDYVREQVKCYLIERQWHHDAAAYIQELVDRAHIEGVDLHPASSTGQAA
jgi:peptidyl-prolyl cis-trans isomerase C